MAKGIAAKPDERHRKAAALYVAGKPIRQSLREAGFAEGTVKMGSTLLNRNLSLKLAVLQEAERIGSLPKIAANAQEGFVRNSLISAALNGKASQAQIQALKLLGSDRRVNMWQPDVQHGVILIGQLPPQDDTPVFEVHPE